jgi:hypothetical protein
MSRRQNAMINLGRISQICIFLLLVSLADLRASERVHFSSLPDKGEVPDAEIDPGGVVHVAYVVGEDAFYVKSSDNGKTFSAPVRINSQPGTVHPANMFRGPDLAIGKNGRVHVIWYVNAYQRKLPQDQWGVFYSYLDPEQSAFARGRNLNHKPSDNYSLAANAKGEMAVVWMAGKIFLTESMDNGETFGESTSIWEANPCECCASRALMKNEGTLFIQYREKQNNERDMYLLTRKGEGPFTKQKISSTEWKINACPMTGCFLSGDAQRLATAWETKGEIFYGMKTGASMPREVAVAKNGKWPIVLASSDGNVLVSWKDGETVKWQSFDQSGKFLELPQSRKSGNVNRHAGVVLKDGSWLLID